MQGKKKDIITDFDSEFCDVDEETKLVQCLNETSPLPV